ncbi:MAG TPA: response regulator transcription factor [Steroidobacteraceae bacterium]|jgi:DNA-binding NarL/FixJ family response regulator|nr:response regulator transcription factor [Steroidobacteraceae bacterium]
MPLKVLVIDDHPLVQEGVAAALEALGHDVDVIAAADSEQGLAAAAANPDIDLVLLDLALPGMSGLGVISALHQRSPSLPVVVLSAMEDPENIRNAISAGAMGFVPKSAQTRVLIEALQQVLEGNVSVPGTRGAATNLAAGGGAAGSAGGGNEPDVALLTLRQLEVLSRLCQGKTNKQIATELGLSEKTVKAHVTAIFKVLGVVNRTQAVLAARRIGMMTT